VGVVIVFVLIVQLEKYESKQGVDVGASGGAARAAESKGWKTLF